MDRNIEKFDLYSSFLLFNINVLSGSVMTVQLHRKIITLKIIPYFKMQYSRTPVDSIRDVVFTVSPKRQYLGIFNPTTPATTGPEEEKKTPH